LRMVTKPVAGQSAHHITTGRRMEWTVNSPSRGDRQPD
jgi:hypothetical protein